MKQGINAHGLVFGVRPFLGTLVLRRFVWKYSDRYGTVCSDEAGRGKAYVWGINRSGARKPNDGTPALPGKRGFFDVAGSNVQIGTPVPFPDRLGGGGV